MKELIINRKIWGRGCGENQGKLLTHDRKAQCCLGIYLSACGLTNKELRSKATPFEVKGGSVPAEAEWLFWGHMASELAGELMETNDRTDISETERELRVKNGFKTVGIEVKFVGKGKPNRK